MIISGNSARQLGGGLYNRGGSNPPLTNVTMSGNFAIIWGNISGGLTTIAGSGAMVSDSLIEGGYGGGTNILDVDPQFVQAAPAAPSTR